MGKTWAIYLRVSTGQQAERGYGLEVQEEKCVEKLRNAGVADWKIYREEGETGEDIDRPAMNKLRKDVDAGLIKGVIAAHPDRISRNLMDKLVFCGDLEKKDVSLVFVDTEYKNTPEGQLFFNMASVIAQYELHRIRIRTTEGRKQAVKKGKIMPMRTAPFGYDLIDGQLVINQREAEIVRLIYSWYVFDRLTMRQIGMKLHDMGVMPKRKESPFWNASSIRRILHSEIYIGKYVYNKRKFKKIKGERTSNGNRKKTYTIRDASEWITVEVPAVISREMFQLAQQQKIKNMVVGKTSTKYQYLLKGLLKCSECGRTWQCTTYHGHEKKDGSQRKRYPVYRCPNLSPKKFGTDKCPSRSINSVYLDRQVWLYITSLVLNKDELRRRIVESKDACAEEVQKEIDVHLDIIKKKNREREKMKTMFVREVITEDEMVSGISRLNKEIEFNRQKIDELQRKLTDIKNSSMTLSQVERKIESVSEKIKSESIDFAERRWLIKSLIDYILITYAPAEERPVLTFYGLIESFGENFGENAEHVSPAVYYSFRELPD